MTTALSQPSSARGRILLAALIAFLLALLGSLALHSHSTLYDTDSYYHLAMARAYGQQGLIHDFPWGRFSVMREGFGDKEILFHLVLAPFALHADPVTGGRWALAVLAALLAAAVAGMAVRAIGWWGLAVPFWLFYASTEFAWRLVRLRPELLSLLLFLAAIWAAGTRRHRTLGCVAAVYSLAYTAIHALLGLVCAWFLFFGWVRRQWRWSMLVCATLGAGLGLVLHPQFPKNLEIWVVQNVALFLYPGSLDLGSEMRSNFTDVALMVNLGWFLGLATLWCSSHETGGQGADEDLADTLAIAALAFAGLYLVMARFSVYLMPVATLWMLFELRRRSRRLSTWTRLPGRGRVPCVAALGLCLLVSFPEARRQLANYVARTSPGPENIRIRDREALADSLPVGSKVAATWGSTAVYMLWAPQSRYLNALNPVFMAIPYPREYAALRHILDAIEPDVPLSTATVLDSDYLAYSLVTESPVLTARLSADPRVEILHRGLNGLFRLVPDANRAFVTDWRVAPEGVKLPLDSPEPAQNWPAYPLHAPGSEARSFEGYIDGSRARTGETCSAFTHFEQVASSSRILYEFAPYGPSSIWLDGRPVLSVDRELRSVLGQGLQFSVDLDPGQHRISVHTCPARMQPQRVGFYLLERGRTISEP